jgi:hypothetical protein
MAFSCRPVTGRRILCAGGAKAKPPAEDSCGLGLFPEAEPATLTEKVRRRVVRWFRMQRRLDADASVDMRARENSGFSVDARVRISFVDRDVPSYFQSLEHLLRYCARPPFPLERLSVRRGEDGRIAGLRYVLPRHKAANWGGPGRGRKSTRPGPMASSNSRHLSSSTGSLTSCPRRGSTGIACRLEASQGCSPRITSSVTCPHE